MANDPPVLIEELPTLSDADYEFHERVLQHPDVVKARARLDDARERQRKAYLASPHRMDDAPMDPPSVEQAELDYWGVLRRVGEQLRREDAEAAR